MTVWPNGGTVMPTISSDFGPRPSTIPGASKLHRGVDFIGFSQIASVDTGLVVAVGTPTGWAGGGRQVWVLHDGYFTRYLHMSGINVNYGDEIAQGHPLGTMGMTGTATGVHLHLELTPGGLTFWNSGQVDPVPFLAQRIGAPAGGGSEPFPTDPVVIKKLRSADVEYIVNVEGIVHHIVPGVNFTFSSESQYNTWRGQLARLRVDGCTNALALPPLKRVRVVDQGQYEVICALNDVKP